MEWSACPDHQGPETILRSQLTEIKRISMFDHQPLAAHHGHHHHHDHDHSHPHQRGGAPAEYAEPLVELKRGGLTESVHRGAVVVCDASGKRIKGVGHPAMPTFLRSCAKPLQALPVISTGAAKAFGLVPEEIACMCGSLNGEDFQVEAVRSILAKAGVDESVLDCGVHRPSHKPSAKALADAGLKPLPIHNNCAGKHAAMLVLCAHLGYGTAGYTEPKHPVQQLILGSVAQMARLPREQVGMGIDGCGVPVYHMPLIYLAGAYARLAAPRKSDLDAETIEAIEEMMQACLDNPRMIAGTGRICTRLMEAAPGKFLAKTGSEGSYALALPELGLGAALNIEDGNWRAVGPAVTKLLHDLGVLGHDVLDGELKDLTWPKLTNHRGEEVAGLGAVFSL